MRSIDALRLMDLCRFKKVFHANPAGCIQLHLSSHSLDLEGHENRCIKCASGLRKIFCVLLCTKKSFVFAVPGDSNTNHQKKSDPYGITSGVFRMRTLQTPKSKLCTITRECCDRILPGHILTNLPALSDSKSLSLFKNSRRWRNQKTGIGQCPAVGASSDLCS